jgi:hypothetical protein
MNQLGLKRQFLIVLLLIAGSKLFSQNASDSIQLKLKGKIELAFTPRGEGIIDYKTSPTDSSSYYKTGWFRFQAGIEFVKSQYLHLFVDYFRVRTDEDSKDKSINSFGFGLQYSFKFDNCVVELKPFRIYKKPIHIRWYPELTGSVGAINLANESFRISGLHQSEKFNVFVQYGIGWNFYINSWLHLSLLYFQEYFPSLNNDPYRFGPLQTKLVFKL